MKQYYKVARPNGFDFHTGNTINYRDNIGKIVKCPSKSTQYEICSDTVIHASELFLDALFYGELPCSVFVLQGTPVVESENKHGFKSLKVIREIDTTNWFQAYCKFMIWMLEDLKNNFDTKQEKDITNAINQTIQVFVNAQKNGTINESAAWSAARSAKMKQLSEKFIELLEES